MILIEKEQIGVNMQIRKSFRNALLIVFIFVVMMNISAASSQNQVTLQLDESWIINADANEIGNREYTIDQSYNFGVFNGIDNSGEQISDIKLAFESYNESMVKAKSSYNDGCGIFNQINSNTIICKNISEDGGAGIFFHTWSQKKITPPFEIKREADNVFFESTGKQILTVKLTPKSNFRNIEVIVGLKSPDINVKVLSTSTNLLYISDRRISFHINSPQVGKEYVLKATLEITPKDEMATFIPGIEASFRETDEQVKQFVGNNTPIFSDFGTGNALSSEDLNFILLERKSFITSFMQISAPTKLAFEGTASTPAATTSPVVSSWISKGNVFMEAHRYPEALDAYNKALELEQNNANAWRGKGLSLNNLGRFQDGIDALDQAIGLDPDYLDAWVHKGYALDNLGRNQDAKAIFQTVINISDKLIAIDPDGNTWKKKGDNPWHYKGSALNYFRKNEDALIAFNIATSIAPDNPYSWYGRGDALFTLGKYQEAVNSYDNAIKIKSNEEGFWRRKGDALKAMGKYQEANEAYDKAYEVTTLSSSSGAGFGAGNWFLEGLKYFSVMVIVSLAIIGIILSIEKREKNKPRFRDDLKTPHRSGYYLILAGQFILCAIFIFISSIIAFKELPIIFDYNKFIFAIPMLYLSVSSFIIAVGLLTSKPSTKLNKVHFFVSLILGISLFAALGDPTTPIFFPFLPLMSAGFSVWYDRIAISKPGYIQDSSSVEKDLNKSIPAINIKRSYAVLPNNDIKFGIRVENETGYTITDIDTILDYNEELFDIKESKIQRISNITPKGVRTITYLLKPLACIHKEQINALITYKDHTGKKQTLHMRSKEMHCITPHLKEKPMSEGEYTQHANIGESVQEGISFKGISVEEMSKFMAVKCKNMLYPVTEYDIEGKKIIYLSGEAIGEKTYYLLTAVIQECNGLTQVALRAYSDKKYGLNGFMNEMADNIRHLVGSVQNAKEIGIIENTQVINIIDSVVQRTSFNMGEGGNTQVNIKDSVVQRRKIGKE